MSLRAQEQALFDLLFDSDLRDEFRLNREQALGIYGLSDDEIKDFACTNINAVEQEALIRQSIVLSQICKDVPWTMSLLSSFENGLDLARDLVKPYMVQLPDTQRNGVFMQVLMGHLDQLAYFNEADANFTQSIIQIETDQLKLASQLDESSDLTKVSRARLPLDELLSWQSGVGLAVLPLPMAVLNESFLKGQTRDYIWRHLQQEPLLIEERIQLFSQAGQAEPNLLMNKAFVAFESNTDSHIDFTMIELNAGFAPFLHHVNGRNSLNNLLEQFKAQGADKAMCERVIKVFNTLCEQGFFQ